MQNKCLNVRKQSLEEKSLKGDFMWFIQISVFYIYLLVFNFDFILGDFKITADGDYSNEIKRHLLLGRKLMTNLDNILKSRDITLPTKVCLVKAMVFPVVMYGCESWTIKKAEHRRIDAFELWCWRRLLRVSWTAKRSNQSILKEISPGCSLEGLMLKLKLQYLNRPGDSMPSWEQIKEQVKGNPWYKKTYKQTKTVCYCISVISGVQGSIPPNSFPT